MVPGDRAMLKIGNTPIQGQSMEDFMRSYELARAQLGLDRPLPVQYLMWMRNVLTLDFGTSIVHHQNIMNLIRPAMFNTIRLNIFTLIFVFFITIPLGIKAAVKHGKVFDKSIQVFTIVGMSVPGFIWALLLICVFSVMLNLLPISGAGTPGFMGTGFSRMLDTAKYMVMPVATMVMMSLAGITRFMRAGMVEALREDYIRTARAKGVREKVVIYSHAFRNSLIPLVTIVPGWFVSLFGGSVIIERMFSWNGMGNLLIESLNTRDFGVSFAVFLFYLVLALTANLISDICYGLADPRAKFN
jgi:peptide/nickel transport system permease protein